MRFDDLQRCSAATLEALAVLTHEAVRAEFPAWLPELEDAREELQIAMARGVRARVAVGAQGQPLGWGAVLEHYDRAWELHPLVVARSHQRAGVGRRLVEELERQARAAGAGVLTLSTADPLGATNLHGHDLYPDPIQALSTFALVRDHPIAFWQRLGYALTGVLPDAEAPGIHSFELTKRLGEMG